MTKNPLWWLLEKSLINTGAAVLKGAEWWSEQEFFSNEDDERPKDDEDEPEEEDDVEDEEHEYEEDDVEDEDSEEDDDSWDEEPSDDVGLRARDQEWCDYDGPEEPTLQKIPDERADTPEHDDEEQRNEKSLAERAAGWGARKLENAVNRLAMSGLRFITDTDWDDDPDLELSYPSELWCKPPHDPDDDWEEPDDYDEPRPERNYDSVYDLITPPGCGEHGDYEDRDLENEGWEEDDEDED